MAINGPTLWGIQAPVTGERPQTELLSNKLFAEIEHKGIRLAWSRAIICPCDDINDQTRQLNPTCPVCVGSGWRYFGPKGYAAPVDVGPELTPLQQALLAKNGAALIRGVVSRASQNQEEFNKLGRWVWTELYASVRPENKLGFHDRLVAIDFSINYSEVVELSDDGTLPLKYLASGVNAVMDLTARYDDLVVVADDGTVSLQGSGLPAAGTKLAVHYLTPPTFVVSDFPHVIRGIQSRAAPGSLTGSYGATVDQPVQAKIRYEFLKPMGEA